MDVEGPVIAPSFLIAGLRVHFGTAIAAAVRHLPTVVVGRQLDSAGMARTRVPAAAWGAAAAGVARNG